LAVAVGSIIWNRTCPDYQSYIELVFQPIQVALKVIHFEHSTYNHRLLQTATILGSPNFPRQHR